MRTMRTSASMGGEDRGQGPGQRTEDQVFLFFLASLGLISLDWVGFAWIGCDFSRRGLVRLGWIRSDWPSSNRFGGKATACGGSQFQKVSPACDSWGWLQPWTEGREPARTLTVRRLVVPWSGSLLPGCLVVALSRAGRITRAKIARPWAGGMEAKGIIPV